MPDQLKITKPKKTANQLISGLKHDKGIAFDLITENDAEQFLMTRNNYFRLMSYKKNYSKDSNGQYINLDFAYLIELSKLDMYIRNHIIKCCIDIEHCLKVKLLNDIEANSAENGYEIVEYFLLENRNHYVLSDISRKSTSHYSGDMIKHYFNYQYTDGKLSFDCPVWAFLEMISFGTLVNFYAFYYSKYGSAPINHKILNSVKSLRNACAHNNCILHDFNTNNNTSPLSEISKYIALNPNIGANSRRKKLTNQFILEFSSLLYVLSKILSPQLLALRQNELKEFSNDRLVKNISYFNKNLVVKSSLEFLKKAIDFF